jgi:hypothetical protein
VLVTVGLVLVGSVGLCLLYKHDHGRPWLLALVAVALGLALLALPIAGKVADMLAGWLMQVAAPYALPVLLFGLLWWLAHRWWRRYPECSPTGRLLVLALTITLGASVAGLLRIAPYLPDAARVAGESAKAGVTAGVEKALDEAAEGAGLNGGGAPP